MALRERRLAVPARGSRTSGRALEQHAATETDQPPRAPARVERDRAGLFGELSGGCMEEDLVARLRAGRLPERFPAIITYGVTREEAQRYGLPCGGKLELVLEKLESATALKSILEKIEFMRCRL